MNNSKFLNLAAWCAQFSAIAAILGLVTLIVFFAWGQPWGTINDLASAALALSAMPVVLSLHLLLRRDPTVLSVTALVGSEAALLTAVAFQLLLVLGLLSFEQTAVVVPAAFGVFGAGLVVHSWLGRADRRWPRKVSLMGIAAGAGYVLVIVGFLLGGQQHPVTAVGGLLAVVCYPIWAIWFARVLRSAEP